METDSTNPDRYEYDSDNTDEFDDSGDVNDFTGNDEYVEYASRWTRGHTLLLIVALMLIGAMAIFVVVPLLQNTNFGAPTYIPPLATPASQL